jgi:NAD(P)-dependent dehydrogenase (short-subunit alcohol dehydrogenase family)
MSTSRRSRRDGPSGRRARRRPLHDRVAVVAGATRGAGRGIAHMLGEAGATVYCTGRSTRASGPPTSGVYRGRPETIEETAERVSAAGGVGVAVRVNHANATEVEALAARVRTEHGRLDILVIDFWGDERPVPFGTPFWELPVEIGRETIERTLWPHVLTARALVPIMFGKRRRRRSPPLVVEVVDGPGLYYRSSFYYDLAATLRLRLAYAMAEDLAPHGVVAVAVTPGYLRSEATLDSFGVGESNWRDAVSRDPNFAVSETPAYLGRGVAALAADPNAASKAGGLYGSWSLAREYGITDLDGASPDFGVHFAEAFGRSPAPARIATRWSLGVAPVGKMSARQARRPAKRQ